MKNLSIRTRILAGLVIVNLLGATAMIVYLHQSYSGNLDVAADKTVRLGAGAWEQIQGDETIDVVKDPAAGMDVLARMKKVTGADYGLLLDKSQLKADDYAAARQKANLPNDWDERENYVLGGVTDEAVAEKMAFGVAAEDVPDIGKIVGIENGACSRTCHDSVHGSGDYWAVQWSTDSRSRAHAVFPVTNERGEQVGVVYALEDISGLAEDAKDSLLRTLLVIALTLVVATVAIGGVLDMLVFKRLNRMIASMEDLSVRIAGGDFDASFEPDGTTDEIGHFEGLFSRLMEIMTGTLKSLMQKSA